MTNLIIKIAIVTAALLLFDLVTTFFALTEVWYWLGLIACGVLIGYYFDRLSDF